MKGAPYLAGALFAALGALFLSYPGAQYDEVFFFNALHGRGVVECAMKFSWGAVPIMLVTYAGTLKAAIYAPLLHWFGPSDITLRVPVLAFGAVSIGLFFLTLRRLTGPAVAALVSLLLATDAVYLLTCVFDWGPVALQHLLGAGTLYCLVRFSRDRAVSWLFVGTLCAGLALWDKALFIWPLAGFGLALLIVYPRDVLAVARRHWALALLGFLLGAAPFLYYNKIHRLRTFTANAQADGQSAASKLSSLVSTINGSGLFGYLVRGEAEGPVQDLRPWERIPLSLSAALGAPRHSFQQYLLWVALLLSPVVCWFGPHRRLALFFWLGGAITYAQMLLTRDAGGAAHHTILLWPVPQILLGLLLSQLLLFWPRRALPVAAALIFLGAVSNVAVLNTYLAHFIACGPGPMWSDAVRPLVQAMGRQPGRTVFAADWGITQQMEYYGQGRLGLQHNSDGIIAELPQPAAVEALERSLADTANLFVMHSDGHEAFTGVRRKLLDFAAERGYRDLLVQTIQDRHGATVFEIHEFRK